MAQVFLSQIGIFGFNFAPMGWAFCNGQIISISQNTALFSLLGTNYGGNGQSTFGLPDMRSRTPLHFDQNYPQGFAAGVESVTLSTSQIPSHKHTISATDTNANVSLASGHFFASGETGKPASPTPTNAYATGAPNVVLNPVALTPYGGNQPHDNIQPCLTVNFCIATVGVFPTRN